MKQSVLQVQPLLQTTSVLTIILTLRHCLGISFLYQRPVGKPECTQAWFWWNNVTKKKLERSQETSWWLGLYLACSWQLSMSPLHSVSSSSNLRRESSPSITITPLAVRVALAEIKWPCFLNSWRELFNVLAEGCGGGAGKVQRQVES